MSRNTFLSYQRDDHGRYPHLLLNGSGNSRSCKFELIDSGDEEGSVKIHAIVSNHFLTASGTSFGCAEQSTNEGVDAFFVFESAENQ